MRPFEYAEPETLDAALALLAAAPEDTLVLAGGTSLVILLKQDLVRPARIVGLRRLRGLADVRRAATAGAIDIGALATHAALARDPLVRSVAPALAATFACVATVRIREQATLGGSLAHADPAQDPPVTLLALDAVVEVRSQALSRRIPLAALFVDVFETTLAPDELIVGVAVPALPPGARATYRKFLPATRDDYATVSVAAVVASGADGACTHARIALGGAGPVPFRAYAAEAALIGRQLGDSAIREAAALAAAATEPFDDLRGSAAYKRAMAEVWTARALREVA